MWWLRSTNRETIVLLRRTALRRRPTSVHARMGAPSTSGTTKRSGWTNLRGPYTTTSTGAMSVSPIACAYVRIDEKEELDDGPLVDHARRRRHEQFPAAE